jgi:hypothetical protein
MLANPLYQQVIDNGNHRGNTIFGDSQWGINGKPGTHDGNMKKMMGLIHGYPGESVKCSLSTK